MGFKSINKAGEIREIVRGLANFSTSQNPPGAIDGEERFYFVTPADVGRKLATLAYLGLTIAG